MGAFVPADPAARASLRSPATAPGKGGLKFLGDRRLQILVIANMLWMGGYSLWTNWTTAYLTYAFPLTVKSVAPFAWIPPVAATLGAFFGGWLSRRPFCVVSRTQCPNLRRADQRDRCADHPRAAILRVTLYSPRQSFRPVTSGPLREASMCIRFQWISGAGNTRVRRFQHWYSVTEFCRRVFRP